MESKIKFFDGSGYIKAFLEKVKLQSALKGYEGEKAAQYLASRLEGQAFDVYIRLSVGDKEKTKKITEELLKEFEAGNQNRELAIDQLNERKRKPEESAQTYAFRIMELTKLAYPDFEENVRKCIAKDHFMKGIHPKMQIALKSSSIFNAANILDIAKETSRLEIAGIQSYSSKKEECFEIQGAESQTIVDMVTDKVIKQMKGVALAAQGIDVETGSAHYVQNRSFRGQRRWKQRQPSRNRPALSQQNRKCRACQSKEHFVRECPTRFCQACGNRGHDSWDKNCPKYQ